MAQLNFKIIGDPDAKEIVLVFLHDAIGSVSQWRNFPESVCNKLSLPGIVYDRKGHGKSPSLEGIRNVDYMHRYAWDELPEFINQTAPDKKLILIGHSDGGSIALLFAAKFPEKTLGIITMAAHVLVEEITLNGIRETAKKFETGEWMEKLRKHHGENTKTIFEAWWKTWTSPEFKDWNIREHLANITCPVFAIQGVDDNYGTEDQVDRILYAIEAYGEKWMIDESCGHAPWKSHSEELIDRINTFIIDRVLPVGYQ